HLAEDPTETRNLAADNPDKLAELQAAWETAAWENQVFPLDEGNFVKSIARPPWNADLEEAVTILPGTPTLERYRSLQLINFRSFAITVALDWQPGDAGILVAHGDQGGGYALYVEDDHLWYVHNGYGTMTEVDCGALAPGASEIVAAFTAHGQLRWELTVSVDGRQVGHVEDLVVLMAMAPFEGIDVGIDRRSPVSWRVYERHGCFPYTGSLGAVTVSPGDYAPDAGVQFLEMLKEMGARFE
ncbi:MAG: hypothetical protein KDB21_02690, partial [Acidimicrobiales bacterium]|nr:hypothetical protein [Acidimicrobiales bacterium]